MSKSQLNRLPISQNGQDSCLFHKMGNFVDWAQYIYYGCIIIKRSNIYKSIIMVLLPKCWSGEITSFGNPEDKEKGMFQKKSISSDFQYDVTSLALKKLKLRF